MPTTGTSEMTVMNTIMSPAHKQIAVLYSQIFTYQIISTICHSWIMYISAFHNTEHKCNRRGKANVE